MPDRDYGDGGKPPIELKDVTGVDIFPEEKVINIYHSDGTVTFIHLDKVCDVNIHHTQPNNNDALKKKLLERQERK